MFFFFFFPPFSSYRIFGETTKKGEKLVEFTLEKNFQFFSQFICVKIAEFPSNLAEFLSNQINY